MPDEQLDAMADSSPADPSTQVNEVEAPADPAVSQSSDESTPSAPSGTEQAETSTTEKPDSPVKAAIDYLTTGDKPVEKKVETPSEKAPATDNSKPEQKSKTEAEQPTPEDENPLADYSPEEQKRLSQKTRTRIETLHHKWKDAEKKYTESQPFVETGKAFTDIVRKFGIQQDLTDITNDADVAAVIRSQAAINRLRTGKGSREDAVWVAKTVAYFDNVRSALGMPDPVSKPSVDPTDLEKAIAAVENDYDIAPLKQILEKIKSGKQERTPAPAPAPQTQTRPQAPAKQPDASEPDPNVTVYSDMLQQRLVADGVKDATKYMEEKLWPNIAVSLATKFPGRDPAAIFDRLSAEARHNLATQAHEQIRKQEAATKPAPRQVASTPRPVSGSGTSTPGQQAPATPTAAAIQFLTQG
jgi:hypothetical protein